MILEYLILFLVWPRIRNSNLMRNSGLAMNSSLYLPQYAVNESVSSQYKQRMIIEIGKYSNHNICGFIILLDLFN